MKMLPDFDGEQEKNMFLKKRKKNVEQTYSNYQMRYGKDRRVENWGENENFP